MKGTFFPTITSNLLLHPAASLAKTKEDRRSLGEAMPETDDEAELEAEDAEDEEVDVGEESDSPAGDTAGAAVVSQKRGRGKSIDTARKRVTGAENKLPGLRAKLETAEKATGYQSSLERRQAAIAKARAKLDNQLAAIEGLKQSLKQAEEEAARKEELDEAKRQRKADEQDAAREWSEAGTVAVVEERLSLEAGFASKKEKNDKVWERVEVLLKARATKGDFPASDLGCLERIKRRWHAEESAYRWYCKEVHRYKVSGAPAEDIEKIPRRCALIDGRTYHLSPVTCHLSPRCHCALMACMGRVLGAQALVRHIRAEQLGQASHERAAAQHQRRQRIKGW